MMQASAAPFASTQISQREQCNQRGSINQTCPNDVGDQQAAVEPVEDIVLPGVMSEQKPGRIGIEGTQNIPFNQPAHQSLLDRDTPGADRPVERADRKSA